MSNKGVVNSWCEPKGKHWGIMKLEVWATNIPQAVFIKAHFAGSIYPHLLCKKVKEERKGRENERGEVGETSLCLWT